MVFKLPTAAIEPSNVTQALLADDVKNALVPVGGIIMWSGTIADIANLTAWELCDGLNGRPDLTDKFVIGASVDATVGNDVKAHTDVEGSNKIEGGNKDAIVPSHDHDTTESGHSHSTNSTSKTLTGTVGKVSETFASGGGYANGIFTKGVNENSSNTPSRVDSSASGSFSINAEHTHGTNSISTGLTVDSRGESVTNKNLPPYYALAFIIRVL